MKATGACSKCGCRDLFYSPQIMDRGDGNEAMPMAIGRGDPIHGLDFGLLEIYVCKTCGLSELYVKEPGAL